VLTVLVVEGDKTRYSSTLLLDIVPSLEGSYLSSLNRNPQNPPGIRVPAKTNFIYRHDLFRALVRLESDDGTGIVTPNEECAKLDEGSKGPTIRAHTNHSTKSTR
jgi:hypothetical protein